MKEQLFILTTILYLAILVLMPKSVLMIALNVACVCYMIHYASEYKEVGNEKCN